jgi:hypothetical protein
MQSNVHVSVSHRIMMMENFGKKLVFYCRLSDKIQYCNINI